MSVEENNTKSLLWEKKDIFFLWFSVGTVPLCNRNEKTGFYFVHVT